MNQRIKYSVLVIVLLGIILIVFRILTPPYKIISWDVFGYYLYLPAKFIYHNLSLTDQSWLKVLFDKYEITTTLYQAVQLPNGNWIMKYSMGLAILYTPFFFIAHMIASLTGNPADGLSLPYQYTLAAGGILFALIGLVYFRKVLSHFFSERTTIILLIIIFAGTNYFQLTAFDGTLLSHNFLFTLYAMLIWFTIRWHENPKYLTVIKIGSLCGLMILIRPTEVVCLLIPIIWNIYNKDTFLQKYFLVRKHFFHLIIAGLAILIIFLPQIIYWKIISGQFFYYSYTNPGEGFEFVRPYILKFLFSFRKGWFIYTPVMVFAIIGFYNLYKNNRKIFPAVFLVFIISLYLISSWSCWWYAGGSFSSRSLVPIYTLLALPMGYFIEDILRKKKLLFILGIIVVFLITLNLFQTWQFEKGILSKERMTRAYYFAVFGKTSVNKKDLKLLLVDRSADIVESFNNESNYIKRTLCSFTFDDQKDSVIISHTGKGSQKLNGSYPYSAGPDIMFKDITSKDHAWIRAGVWIYIPETYSEELPLLVITFHHKGEAYKYRTVEIPKDSLIKGQWKYLTADYLTPEVRSPEDNLKVYIWHRGQQDIWIDDLVVDIFEPK